MESHLRRTPRSSRVRQQSAVEATWRWSKARRPSGRNPKVEVQERRSCFCPTFVRWPCDRSALPRVGAVENTEVELPFRPLREPTPTEPRADSERSHIPIRPSAQSRSRSDGGHGIATTQRTTRRPSDLTPTRFRVRHAIGSITCHETRHAT